MFSQDDDSHQRVALLVVSGLVALVVASIIAVGVHKSARVPSPAASFAAGIEPVNPAPDSLGSAQAELDATSVQVERGVVMFYFASGKAQLPPGAGQVLADMVKGVPAGRKLVISGFHDATGGAAQNADLARKRALAVRDALKAAGVGAEQIVLKKPEAVADSASSEQARRVEISVL